MSSITSDADWAGAETNHGKTAEELQTLYRRVVAEEEARSLQLVNRIWIKLNHALNQGEDVAKKWFVRGALTSRQLEMLQKLGCRVKNASGVCCAGYDIILSEVDRTARANAGLAPDLC